MPELHKIGSNTPGTLCSLVVILVFIDMTLFGAYQVSLEYFNSIAAVYFCVSVMISVNGNIYHNQYAIKVTIEIYIGYTYCINDQNLQFYVRFAEEIKKLEQLERNLECHLLKIFSTTTFYTKYLILTKGMPNILILINISSHSSEGGGREECDRRVRVIVIMLGLL